VEMEVSRQEEPYLCVGGKGSRRAEERRVTTMQAYNHIALWAHWCWHGPQRRSGLVGGSWTWIGLDLAEDSARWTLERLRAICSADSSPAAGPTSPH
jgi:hypothetical protein